MIWEEVKFPASFQMLQSDVVRPTGT